MTNSDYIHAVVTNALKLASVQSEIIKIMKPAMEYGRIGLVDAQHLLELVKSADKLAKELESLKIAPIEELQ